MKLGNFFRGIPSFKGKLRLARFLTDRTLKDTEISTRSGKFILPNLIDNQYFELYIQGYYEIDLVQFIIKTLPANGCLLDVGANIGSVCIPIALARPDVRILTVEALPTNYDYLEKNLKLNNIHNVTALNVCCSNKIGEIKKFYFDERLKGSSSFHSLHSKNFVELSTTTLDEQLNKSGVTKVDILKIDTEGSEALIFQGAYQLLTTSKPKILFEFIDTYENAIEGLKGGDAQKLLLDHEYKIYDFFSYPHAEPIERAHLKGSYEFLAIHD